MTTVAIAYPRSRRSLPANAVLALAGDLASKGAQLAVVVVCARLLPVSQVALLGVCLAGATLLMSLLDAGTSLVITRDGAAGGSAATLLARTGLIRLPLAAATLAGAAGVGWVTGHLVAALLAAAVGLLGAVSLSVLAVYRAQQDLSIEAGQKLVAGLLSLGAAVVFVVGHRTGAAALAGLALGPALTLPSLLARQWAYYRPAPAPPARKVLRDALPFGAMALATLAYYRTPTLVLGAFGTHAAVARYTIASTLGFGTLAVANAITTGLLPRLASLAPERRPALARDSLAWTLRLAVVAGAVVVGGGPRLLSATLGETYGAAFPALVVLLGSTFLIGASGVLGTVLTVERRTGALVRQVAIALVANVALSLVLAPRFGAMGAAIATLVTEAIAFGLLLRASSGLVARLDPRFAAQLALAVGAGSGSLALGGVWRPVGAGVAAALVFVDLKGIAIPVPKPATLLGTGVIAWTLLLEAWAMYANYGLRVIADTPTYLQLLRDLALHPFQRPATPFISGTVNLAHATPDLQGLAFVWKGLAAVGLANRNLIDAIPAYDLLAVKGMVVTLLVFHALHVWVRRQFGSRLAWLTIAVLPAVWGPALIICPGDLSLHGFMSTADHSEPFAIALLLYTLVGLEGKLTIARLVPASALCAAVMVTHPFTGVRLAALASALACYHVLRGEAQRTWKLTPPALILGYLVASLWPAYSLSDAMQIGPLVGWEIIPLLAGAPYLAFAVAQRGWSLPAVRVPRLRVSLTTVLVALGLVAAVVVAGREIWLYLHPDPMLYTNRPAIYWGGPSIRFWPLLLAPGFVGFVGLIRLARRDRPLPLLWATGCFAIGLIGAAGVQLPLWHRFLLFAQIPLALGTATVLSERPWGRAQRLATKTLVGSAVFAFLTLLLMPPTVTYFRTPLQAGWSLDQMLPVGSSTVVASDPASSYFVLPLGDRVLTMTTWHIGGPSELIPARSGYVLIHRLYMGDRWRAAAQQMWRLGVRYVVVNRGFRMQTPTVDRFSGFSTPYLVRSWANQAEVLRYMHRVASISTETAAANEFHVYKLSKKKLFG